MTTIKTFEDMNLAPAITSALTDIGFTMPMPVQAAVYADCMSGRDLIVQSQTGSGKTAAFGLPLIQQINPENTMVCALILVPTRELASQVAKELSALAQHTKINVIPVYGGTPIQKQINALKKSIHIVVGTPGRVSDHLRRGTIKIKSAQYLVLDECDEMLSMGFLEAIEKIMEYLPAQQKRQTLLFSATIPKQIQRITKRHLNDPKSISFLNQSISAAEIDHSYYVVNGIKRNRDLLAAMTAEKIDSAIVFCNTKIATVSVAKYLTTYGYDAAAISSDLRQSSRERVLDKMRTKKLKCLVGTDVAARGIDIPNVSHVFNYTFPDSAETYIHRTGRTGRAGNRGKAISLIGPKELQSFRQMRKIYQITPKERELPPPPPVIKSTNKDTDFKKTTPRHQNTKQGTRTGTKSSNRSGAGKRSGTTTSNRSGGSGAGKRSGTTTSNRSGGSGAGKRSGTTTSNRSGGSGAGKRSGTTTSNRSGGSGAGKRSGTTTSNRSGGSGAGKRSGTTTSNRSGSGAGKRSGTTTSNRIDLALVSDQEQPRVIDLVDLVLVSDQEQPRVIDLVDLVLVNDQEQPRVIDLALVNDQEQPRAIDLALVNDQELPQAIDLALVNDQEQPRAIDLALVNDQEQPRAIDLALVNDQELPQAIDLALVNDQELPQAIDLVLVKLNTNEENL